MMDMMILGMRGASQVGEVLQVILMRTTHWTWSSKWVSFVRHGLSQSALLWAPFSCSVDIFANLLGNLKFLQRMVCSQWESF